MSKGKYDPDPRLARASALRFEAQALRSEYEADALRVDDCEPALIAARQIEINMLTRESAFCRDWAAAWNEVARLAKEAADAKP